MMPIFHFSFFWTTFGFLVGKRSWQPCVPPDTTKKLADWENLFGQPLYQNNVFEIFSDKMISGLLHLFV